MGADADRDGHADQRIEPSATGGQTFTVMLNTDDSDGDLTDVVCSSIS